MSVEPNRSRHKCSAIGRQAPIRQRLEGSYLGMARAGKKSL
jgi:hypothetical protein